MTERGKLMFRIRDVNDQIHTLADVAATNDKYDADSSRLHQAHSALSLAHSIIASLDNKDLNYEDD